MEHEAEYNAIEAHLRALDRQARDACYELLVLLVQSRDKAHVLSADWERTSRKLPPAKRKEVSSLLLGSGGVFAHDDDVLLTLGFHPNVHNYNVTIDFEADLSSSCYRKRPDALPTNVPERPISAGAECNDTGHLIRPTPEETATNSFCIREETPASSAVSSLSSNFFPDVDPDSTARLPPFSQSPPVKLKRGRPKKAPTSQQRKRRRILIDDDNYDDSDVDDDCEDNSKKKKNNRRNTKRENNNNKNNSDKMICEKCTPPSSLTNKTSFIRHMKQFHGEDQGKGYRCPVKVSGTRSVCHKAIRDPANVRRHLMDQHGMTRPAANEIFYKLKLVFIPNLPTKRDKKKS